MAFAKSAVPVAGGLAAAALVLICTCRYGPGLSPDSVSYVSAARSVAAGRGFVRYDGSACAWWPPLFPTAMGAFGSAGMDEVSAARWLNALAFGGIVAMAGFWVLKRTGSFWCVLATCLLVLTSMPMLEVSVYVWTEPLFILATMAFLMVAEPLLAGPTLGRAAAAGLVAAVACLTRYSGVTLIVTGAAVLAVAGGVRLRNRLQAMALFVVVAALPLGLWFVRNWTVTGTLTGQRPPARMDLSTTFAFAGRDLGLGLVPWPIVLTLPGLGLFLPLAGAGVLALVAGLVSYARRGEGSPLRPTLPACILAIVYVGTVIAAVARVALDPMGTRQLAPVYPLLLLMLVHWAWASRHLLRTSEGRPVFSAAAAALAAATTLLIVGLIALSAGRMPVRIRQLRADGLGYSAKVWRNSPTMAYLRSQALEGILVSNAPDAIYILTGRGATMSPQRTPYQSDQFVGDRELAALDADLAASRGAYLVWFDATNREYLYTEDALKERYVLEPLAELADGRVYRFVGASTASRPTEHARQGVRRAGGMVISRRLRVALLTDVRMRKADQASLARSRR